MADKGHKVLTISDRVEFLKKCAALSGDRAACVTGEVKDSNARDKVHKAISNSEIDILYGTMSIYKEGISENTLSSLVLGTPINNDPLLEQLIGRIVRVVEGKKQPVVVDINLKGNTAKRQANLRLGHYMAKGYDIQVITA